jgi:hypothetical protein
MGDGVTPLAYKLAKQLVLPVKRREPFWAANFPNLRRALTDIHCFEVSAAIPMIEELASSTSSMSEDQCDAFFGRMCFLPAPKTWLEWRHPGVGQRIALLLTERKDDWADVEIFFDGSEIRTAGYAGKISLNDSTWSCPGVDVATPKEWEILPGKAINGFLAAAHYILVLINTPRIIGRRQHMPHRGIERDLTAKMGRGKFPLHAWTEIELKIAKPTEIDDGEPHEAHLTGRRALHFCRAHLRIRLGRLEYVTSHWRGDPALGIKQSRYKLAS